MKIDAGQKWRSGKQVTGCRMGHRVNPASTRADAIFARMAFGQVKVELCIASYRLISLGTAWYRLAVARLRIHREVFNGGFYGQRFRLISAFSPFLAFLWGAPDLPIRPSLPSGRKL